MNRNDVCNYLHTFCFKFSFLDYLLVRKYLNRKEDRIISKDESSYIAEIGKNVEVKDIMDVGERSVRFALHLNDAETITFTDRLQQKQEETKSGYLAAKNAIRWALDAAGNTGQYIKYVNMKIDKHHEQIKNIHELHKKFDREIAMLQSQKLDKIDLDKNSINNMDIKSVTNVLDQLLLGKRNTKSKLQKLEYECSLAEKELEKQESQIEEVRKNLKESTFNRSNVFDKENNFAALKIIKEEINRLSKEQDVTKLSHAIDVLASSLDFK